jgi:GAF domain-containing protein
LSGNRDEQDGGPGRAPYATWEAGAADALIGGGEMGALMRALDWASTPLGPVERWSPSLRTMVGILLANRFPLLLWWGPDHLQLYNDAYRPVLGAKHPRSLGQPARECWPEIWPIIGPLIQTPYEGGPSTWDEDLFLEPNRHGYVEETHFTVAYSPVPDPSVPGGIGGVLATVHEITQQVIQERRLAVLRDLGARASDAKTAEEACAIAAATLEHHPRDVPFALLYLIGAEQRVACLAATAGVPAGQVPGPAVVDLTADEEHSAWPLAAVLRTDQAQVVTPLHDRLGVVPPGPWSDPPEQALVLPLPSATPHRPAGLLVLGLSARLALDDAYCSFGALVAGQIGTAISNARAYEEERRRAEALAELDRAKTAFFNNVSHEFRTPLTLLLGPLEEALAAPPETSLRAERAALESAHRNGLRLLRLVNTLLDFSRIEAGRAEASYEPTNLAALTADLASVFRSAVERAGLRLVVDCPPLREPVYVDREMWEKIVLNLLSNAFNSPSRAKSRSHCMWLARRWSWWYATPAPASRRRNCPTYSSDSTACVGYGRERTRARASGWRWCGSWWPYMAARSAWRAWWTAGPRSP